MVGFTCRRNNPFYFDKEDFPLISSYHWLLDSDHNVFTRIDGKKTTMHKLLLGEGPHVHKNGKNNDNRKHNLRSARGYRNQGQVKSNGYNTIYMPEHPKAFDNGCVYEHVLIAEKMLGRPLTSEEVVHHKDENKTHNQDNNLMVFATDKDHLNYHGGGVLIPQKDGTFKCLPKNGRIRETIIVDGKAKVIRREICPVCKTNYKTITAKTCLACFREETSIHIPEKKTLEALLSKNSLTKIGKMYGVTGNAVRKWCKKYELSYRK